MYTTGALIYIGSGIERSESSKKWAVEGWLRLYFHLCSSVLRSLEVDLCESIIKTAINEEQRNEMEGHGNSGNRDSD